MMNSKTNEDDDLPAGLRSSTQINYSIGKMHNDVPSVAKAEPAKSEPVKANQSQMYVPVEAQAFRDKDAFLILSKELSDAESRFANGDKRAAADIAGLKREIERATGKSPMANQNPSLVVQDESEDDVAPGLKNSMSVDYNKKSITPQKKNFISNQTGTEMAVGALAGAYMANNRRKDANAQATTVDAKYANLPLEMRPMSAESLQKYINSQFSVKIPLDKLSELTKDISMHGAPEPSLLSRAGNAISNGTKSMVSGLGNFLRPMAGGIVAAPQLMEAGTDMMRGRQVDPTQVASGLGGLAMMLRSTPVGAVGALAQIPYAIKHREELARAMTMHDVNPTAFPLGTVGADEPLVPR